MTRRTRRNHSAAFKAKVALTDSEAEQVFFCTDLLVVADARHSQAEPRFHALGETLSRRRLHVTFTLRADNTLVRVVSARLMNRRERTVYEAQAEDNS